MTGAINYNYGELQGMVSDLLKAQSQIQDEVNQLIQQTRQTCGEYFTGSSADQYNQLAGQIGQDFTANATQLQQLAHSVGSGTDNMQQMDAQQAKRFQ